MNNSIYISDLYLLLKLYAPSVYQLDVWDPNENIQLDAPWKFQTKKTSDFKVLVFLPSIIEVYSGEPMSEYDLVLDFSKSVSDFGPYQFNINYLNNPNGKMRWLYTDKNRKATFLKFYNAGTRIAKLKAFVIQVGFALGLQNWIRSGCIRIHSKKELKLTQLIQEVPHTDHSLFLGSEGDNRTVLVEVNSQNESTHFFKIPLTKESIRSVANEKRFLQMLQDRSFQFIRVPPTVSSRFGDVLITKGIELAQAKRSVVFTELHYSAIQEMTLKTKQFSRLQDSAFWLQVEDNLSQLKKNETFSNAIGLAHQLKSDLSNNRGIYTGISHGDFTPWNMYVTPKKLQVYDWEMAENEMPLLFDLFHFHFQTGVLIHRHSFKEIKATILKACKHPKMESLLLVYDIDLALYIQLYVLKSATKYFIEFQNQPVLNPQNKWLLEALTDALTDSCMFKNGEAHRPVFITDLNAEMGKFSHVYLKLLEPEITQLPINSDLDILVDAQAVNQLVGFCENHSYVEKVKVYTKSFMSTVDIYFKDQGFLVVDFIHSFKRKHVQFMDPKTVLNSSHPNIYGYRVPDPVLDFEYVYLFYQLNGASVPEKYQKYYTELQADEVNEIPSHIQIKYELLQYSEDQLMAFHPDIQNQLLHKLASFSLNSGVCLVKNVFQYFSDTVYDLVNRQGLVITFSGVDGAGKTTLIGKVKRKLEDKYRKEVVLLRHRPGIFPILSALKHGKKEAEKIASVTLPRKGNNKNMLSSLARFAYYFSDYIFGQIYVYFKYTLRGKVVLYDRYYFDFINDSKRSNILLNRGFIKSLYRFVFKPDLNFFLYADAPTILNRKKEMVEEEIVRISSLYQNLFSQMSTEYESSVYTSIENKNLEDTLNQVLLSYQKVA